MSKLGLALLGAPEVRHGEQIVRFPTRKAVALLIYLAVEGGRHSREKLADLLWPDRDADRSRGALRTTLGLLRGALQATADDAGSGHLTVEQDFLSVTLGREDFLDLASLGEAAALARGSDYRSSDEVIGRLQSALALVRGDFLDGFSLGDAPSFDDWASVHRESWHRRVGQVYDRLSQELFDGGALASAVDLTARWIAYEPLNETAHRRLMRLHVANRDRGAALRAYEACESVLARELNAEPSPETAALRERIRSGPLPGRGRRRDSKADVPPEVPLIGRQAEHARLVGAYRETRHGHFTVVVVEGEAGIGKTRLVTAFLNWAAAQGATVLRGRAFEAGVGISYHPIVEALRGWLAISADPRQVLTDVWLAELGRLLPELPERYPQLPSPPQLGENESRGRVYDAVFRLGQSLARPRPLVFFIDDLQWADTASRDLLLYAAHEWASQKSPVLVVVTVRAEELKAAWLEEWLDGFGRGVPVTRVEVGRLSREDTATLVAHYGVSDAGLAEQLFAESGGQPLFAVEMAKALAESRNESTRSIPRSEFLPPGVQDVIRTRLRSLSPLARHLIVAASILGDALAFEMVYRVAGVGENEGLTALDELLARRLLQEDDTVYRFGHDKIREVAYGDAGDARRRVYHRRALDVLKAGSRPAAELARHAYAAGLLDRAAELSLSAGEEAMRVFAVRDAIANFERGLAWRPAPLDATSAPALLQLGRAYELASQYAPARDTYEKVLELARQARDPKLEREVLNRMALVAMLGPQLDLPGAAALLERALAVAQSGDDLEGLAETETNLSRFSFYCFDVAASHDHGLRALAGARELGRPDLIARSLNWLGLIEVHVGQWETAQTCATEAAELFRQLGERSMEADSLVQLAAAQIRFGQTSEGIDAARGALALSRDMENRWGEADANRELALGLLEAGKYGQALAAARASVAGARAAGYPPMLIIGLTVLGMVCRRVGLLADARAADEEVLAIGEGMGYPPFVELASSGLCADAALLGDWEQAAKFARRASALRTWAVSLAGLTRWYEVDALARAGELERATADVEHFRAYVADNRRFRIPYLRCLAVLASTSRELEAAESYLLEARGIAEELCLPGELLSIDAALAELARELRDGARVESHVTGAVQTFNHLASSIDDPAIRTSLAELWRSTLPLNQEGFDLRPL